ncbi:MAG: nitrogenase iron protein, partial [Chloroflexales bacterium]|nr:nitrogenase iron protein [Chloroflexales bacterium]
VVCGGFAVPIREGITDKVYVVSSSDFMAIYAANNLFRAISKYAPSGGALLGGIIANGLIAPYAASLVDDFAQRTSTSTVAYLPRSSVVAQSELYGQTVIEANPASAQAELYRRLARAIAAGHPLRIPTPLSVIELRDWARAWGDRILQQEAGVVSLQEAI